MGAHRIFMVRRLTAVQQVSKHIFAGTLSLNLAENMNGDPSLRTFTSGGGVTLLLERIALHKAGRRLRCSRLSATKAVIPLFPEKSFVVESDE